MCGYTDYNDPRLQPSDVGDDEDMTPAECWARCVHGDACRAVLCRVNGRYYSGDGEVATVMGCAECNEWEDMG
jgi:hypothetical protein